MSMCVRLCSRLLLSAGIALSKFHVFPQAWATCKGFRGSALELALLRETISSNPERTMQRERSSGNRKSWGTARSSVAASSREVEPP